MKYAQQQKNLDWKVIEVSNENDPIVQDGTWYKLIEHEEPHDSWNFIEDKWSSVIELFPQHKLKHLHAFHRVLPSGAPDGHLLPKLITEV